MTDDIHGLDVASGNQLHVQVAQTILAVSRESTSDASYVAPGWIDLQVNGFAGVDYNSSTTSPDAIGDSIRALVATGVTRCYPTVITASVGDMCAALDNLARARESLDLGEVFDGFHVEGPHISPDDGPRGAHPKRWVSAPDVETFHRLQDAARGHIRLVTVAPEWPQAPAYIETLTSLGIVVAIGHTGASTTQVANAVAAGATMSTHLGNGAHAELRRHPNYLWDQLADDRLTASFIADGIHLSSAFLSVAIRAKHPHRCVLVTDASAPAGASPGTYRLGAQTIHLTTEGRVVQADGGRLAGSALRMDEAVGNVMALAGVSLTDAVAMATTTAATAGRVPGRQHGLRVGDRADIVTFRVSPENGRVQVEATWVSGRNVYRRSP